MNPVTIIFTLIGSLFFAFSIRIISLTAIGDNFLHHQSWWVYMLLLGIGFSGFMAIKHWIEERRQIKSPHENPSLGAKFFHQN